MKSGFFSIFALLSILFFSGCSQERSDTDKLTVAVGLPPIAGIAEFISGGNAKIISVLPQGRTPHDFAPRTSTMRQAANAKMFFSTGMPFENKIARFMENNGKKVYDISEGIKRIAFHDGGDHHHHHHDGCTHDDHDPHVWLSPANAVIIAENIASHLVDADPVNRDIYLKNLEILKKRFSEIDRDISSRLAVHKGKVFFVYHPAFGYFADAYGLKQRAIELNGREATAVQLAKITGEAKKAGVSTIFVQEQFNPGSAEALARQSGGEVSALDPLATDLAENLKKIADSLEKGFNAQKK